MAARNILLPLDGSEFGRVALQTLERLFDPPLTHVIVAHVAPVPEAIAEPLAPPTVLLPWGSEYTPWTQPLARRHPVFQSQEWEAARTGIVDAFEPDAAALRDAGYAVSLAVRFGDPAQELADLVEEGGVDAIVMATHGRSGVTRALLGSVAEKLLRMVLVPVVMVRPGRLPDEATPLAPWV
jgi:nucleotide-binding universal stress UspA family protein